MPSRFNAPAPDLLASDSEPDAAPTTEAPDEARQRVSFSDLRGAARLVADGAVGTTHLVEAMHARIAGLLLLRPTRRPSRARGLTGWIYRAIRRIMRLTGRGVGSALRVADRGSGPLPDGRDTEGRGRVLSVLNGILGDRLSETSNPLARPFTLRTADGRLGDAQAVSSDGVVLFVHGLCLSDRSWAPTSRQAGHVQAVAETTGGMPLFARYNTGLSIDANGRLLARHLQALKTRSSEPPRIVIVAHSMGGLVVRGALWHARRASENWPDRVTEIAYLGTPHRGAPLERAGAWVETQLNRTGLTAPFTAATTLRSQGIQDLRHGVAALAEGSGGLDSSAGAWRTLYVAATLASDPALRRNLGDGLVPLESALGTPGASPASGRDAASPETRRVFPNLGHFDLLHAPVVTNALQTWLAANDDALESPPPGSDTVRNLSAQRNQPSTCRRSCTSL